jgi:predicted alternative tryptophan synthase beta-subunit
VFLQQCLFVQRKRLMVEGYPRSPVQRHCYPDMIIGCVGGGSSFAGLFEPFYYDNVNGKAPKNVGFTAVESTACPSMTAG